MPIFAVRGTSSPRPIHFVTRTPFVVKRCVLPPWRMGRGVPAALPVPGPPPDHANHPDFTKMSEAARSRRWGFLRDYLTLPTVAARTTAGGVQEPSVISTFGQ